MHLLPTDFVERVHALLPRHDVGYALDRVAEQAGFGSYASLRYHFLRTVGVPPQKYRQSYTASR